MERTYGRLHVHLVWATKHRLDTIAEDWRERLYAYVGGIVRRCEGTMFAIGGTANHVHIYLECSTTMSISKLVNKIKANSARWIHDSFADSREFQWQRGYGVFSVDSRNAAALVRYIANQARHHRGTGFDAEYGSIVKSYGLELTDSAFD